MPARFQIAKSACTSARESSASCANADFSDVDAEPAMADCIEINASPRGRYFKKFFTRNSLRSDSSRAFKRGKMSFKNQIRSEEHTSELQSLMRISYAVFCLKKKIKNIQ